MHDPRLVLLSRAATIGLRALVELAREPGLTLSVAEMARRQQLPQPMLEQILLRLRRHGLVEARRGRHGGYRLAVQAETLPLARVLQAVEVRRAIPQAASAETALPRLDQPEGSAGWGVPTAVDAPTAVWGEQAPTPGAGLAGGPAPDATRPEAKAQRPDSLGASAGHRVEQQLRRRLERLVQLELQRLTLAELLYDQRSWEASLGPEGGVMVM